MASSVRTGLAAAEDLPTGLLVDGAWQAASDGGTLDNIDPVDERVLATVAAATPADVDVAVRAARLRFDDGSWSRTPGSQRGLLLWRLADLVERDGALLARVQAAENGVSEQAALAFDVGGAVRTLRYYAGWADKTEGVVIPAECHGRPTHAYAVREPVGVVGAIIPWNAPLTAAVNKIAPALAVGCTVVVKPAEEAQLTVLHLGALTVEAGLPPGVVNIVPGTGPVAGARLAGHPAVDHISFTGSREVGRLIHRAAGDHFTRTTLELGGKSPQLLFADADLDAAIAGTVGGLFANQGQVCAAASRILVQRPVHDAVVTALAGAAASVRLGDPRQPDTDMGPLISRAQLDRVLGYVDTGREEGARLVAGGERVRDRGYFVRPAIFADATNDMTIAREEIFGPVGTVIPFDTEEEAVALANDSRYGLAATIWTRDVSRAHRLARDIRAGSVWVNGWGAMDASLPWGGAKQSGLGRELGRPGIEDLTETKAVTVLL